MVGNTGTLMTMRIVRNKIRNRDDSTTTAAQMDQNELQQQQQQQVPQQSSFSRAHKHLSISFRLPKDHQQQQAGESSSRFYTTLSSNSNSKRASSPAADNKEVVGFTRTSGIGVMASNNWVFPPNAPTPNIYHCLDTDALSAANDNSGFKGFRKQFSGRFKRLVAVKKPEPASVIPPHLKPQLKTIYVY